MISFFVFVIGAIIGSFLNAVIFRLHTGQHIISDRSKCVDCGHVLSALDLVPVFSFIFLTGRCRYCGKKISLQYPLVEITTAIVFVLLFLSHGSRITDHGFWFQAVASGFLIVIGVYDFKHFLILDKVVYPAIVLAAIAGIVNGHFLSGLIAALIIGGFFAAQYFISSGRWIGFGDVKLGIFLGMLLGVKLGLSMLMLAYLLGAAMGFILIAAGRKNLGSKLPFGSFLAISAIIIMIYGDKIANWYLRLIGF